MTNRRVLIVGGGKVASRKVAGLIAAGADQIRLVSPELRAAFPEQVEKIARPYQPGDVAGADLVFAATDAPAVNDAVVSEARTRGIWVNRADFSDELPGDFSTPAMLDAGAITITVSTGSPPLSTMIRDELQNRLDPQWLAMAGAMRVLRPIIQKSEPDGSARVRWFRWLATPEAFAVLRDSGIDGLRNRITLR